MKIPNTLLLTYQAEYQNTDITIEALCDKYDVQTKQLKGYTKWSKNIDIPGKSEEPLDIIVIPEDSQEPLDSQQLVTTDDSLDTKDKIDTFKKLALDNAVRFMQEDVQFAEVKEFKDMVAIVDSIEKSYKDDKTGETNVNILIQNLTQKFKDTPDDC